MKKVIIVDDETIIRVTLRSQIDWETYGFQVVADFMSAVQALAFCKENPVDLVMTDMKMPGMTGLELMEELRKENCHPMIVALSGYNEFELVREAFRLGAYDYFLKSDLNEANMGKLLKALQGKITESESEKLENGGVPLGVPMSNRKQEPLEEGKYGVVLFEVDEFIKQVSRFGDEWEEKMEKPMLELARQIPRVASRASIKAVYPSRYLLYYRIHDERQFKQTIISVVKQLQMVWHDYMNLTVSAAISDITDETGLEKAIDIDNSLLLFCVLHGRRSVCTQWEQRNLLDKRKEASNRYAKMTSALYEGNKGIFSEEKDGFFAYINVLAEGEAREEILLVIALLADKFKEFNDDFFTLFPEEINYEEKILRLQSSRERELWLNNFFRWIQEYLSKKNDNRQADLIQRAKRFMEDNYVNPEITLGNVADYIGLNEKYFSSRFTKENGCTFSTYLTDIRMQKAKELLKTTDLKMYEISSRVGYQNVEHFNRTFKKVFSYSPGDYKKSK